MIPVIHSHVVATRNHAHTVVRDLHGLPSKEMTFPELGQIAIPATHGHVRTRGVVQQDGRNVEF